MPQTLIIRPEHSIMRKLSLFALSGLILAGCGAKILRADGPYLQHGPADAPLNEFTLPDAEHCKYMLGTYGNQPVRCTAESIKLPFAGKVRNDFWGISIPVSGRTLPACEDMLIRMSKTKGWRTEEACVQVGEPIVTTLPATETAADKKSPARTQPKKKAPPAAQSAPAP